MRGDSPVIAEQKKDGLLIAPEPRISVGIVVGVPELKGRFDGTFAADDGVLFTGSFAVRAHEEGLMFTDGAGERRLHRTKMLFVPYAGAAFTIFGVTIGRQFHWERRQDQTFRGELELLAGDGGQVTAINRLCLEEYLTSVISSEMSAASPPEMLKAHAVAARSWLAAMLRQRGNSPDAGVYRSESNGNIHEIERWYGREEHELFDVCADDHCQRYQGITKIISPQAAEAVDATRGVFLVYDGAICDARYHKACGGRTDDFENTWADRGVPYLTSVADAALHLDPVLTEDAARQWVQTRPDVYCNCADPELLGRVLPDFDRETTDFFRWRMACEAGELSLIIREKSGIDIGRLSDIVALQRGPSGRIMRLRLDGTRRTLIVGRELEIRRCLSRSHLLSSAFCVSVERDASGEPVRFVLDGAGWGHGVGLCQIGAAVMAERGHKAEAILRHYFHGAKLEKLYD